MTDAGLHMKEGTVAMSQQLGWGHPAYLSVLKRDAQFLRENRQVEAANVVERRIRQAEDIVDSDTSGYVRLREITLGCCCRRRGLGVLVVRGGVRAVR